MAEVKEKNFLNLKLGTDIEPPRKKEYEKVAEVLTSLQETGRVPDTTTPQTDVTPDYVSESRRLITEQDPAARLKMERDFQTKVNQGWVTDTHFSPDTMFNSGTPGTVEEQDWVRNFNINTGRLPTDRELSAWAQTQDRNQWTWAEGSPMRNLGFKTYDEFVKAQHAPGSIGGENYGPWAGSLVPEGGTVINDEKGQPWFRTFRNDQTVQGYAGKYGTVPATDTERYPTYNRERALPPTENEELLSSYNPQTVYSARLSDYLDQQVREGTATINQMEKNIHNIAQETSDKQTEVQHGIDSGKYTQINGDALIASLEKEGLAIIASLQNIIDNSMTEDKKAQTLSDTQYQVGLGTDVSTLPFFNESQGAIGASVTKLLTDAVESFKTGEEKRLKNIPEWRGYANEQIAVPKGTEQAEYLTWVDRLQSPNEVKAWLNNNYFNLYDQWMKAGQYKDFVSWVKDYIKGGG